METGNIEDLEEEIRIGETLLRNEILMQPHRKNSFLSN